MSSLLLERGVPGVADDQRAEHGADSRAGAGDADGGRARSDELGRAVDVLARRGGLDGARLHAGRRGGPRCL